MEDNRDYVIIPNPDFIHRKKIEEEIKKNNGFCISAVKQNEDTKCICAEFRNQQYSGWCKCKQFYKILRASKVYLCGNIELKDQILELAHKLTLEGYIVLSPNSFINYQELTDQEKQLAKETCKAEIAEADFICVIDQNGYIDELTREQINWATQLEKKIEYIENNIN